MTDAIRTDRPAVAAGAAGEASRLMYAARQALLWAGVATVIAVPMLTLVATQDVTHLKIVPRILVPAIGVGLIALLRFVTALLPEAGTSSPVQTALQAHARRGFVALAPWSLVGLIARFAYQSMTPDPAGLTLINAAVPVLALATYLYFVFAPAGEPLYRTLAKRMPLAYSIAMLAAGAILPFLPFADRYVLDISILIITYIMLGWGLNIVVGLAGLLDLGYVAFYAVGAYSFALLASNFGLSFWICLPLSGILAGFWGLILGFPVLRLRGDYLAIVTLAFGEIIRLVLINWFSLTRGPQGIQIDPGLRPSFFGLEFKSSGPGTFAEFFHIPYAPIHRIMWLYYIILAMALLTNLVSMRLRRLPIGRAWEALREDEIACRSLGINTTNTKLTAFALGAMFGGFAGAFFATKQGLVSPEAFNFLESATILAIVVLGGLGSQFGIVVSAIVMIGGTELLRNLGFLKSIFGEDFDPIQYRMVLFGLALVLIMRYRPRGFVSTRAPTVSLGKSRAISGDLVKEGHG